MPTKPRDLADRFFEHVAVGDDFECWPWQGGRHEQGYGWFKLAGKAVKAHRVAYEWFWGTLPKGLVVRHTCDNPPCVNPSHLVAGTQKDNAADAIERGGFARTLASVRRLTEDQVRTIRRERPEGPTAARIYGVSSSTIYDILRGKTWRSLN